MAEVSKARRIPVTFGTNRQQMVTGITNSVSDIRAAKAATFRINLLLKNQPAKNTLISEIKILKQVFVA